MAYNTKTERSMQAVLVFVDSRPAAGRLSQSLLALLLRHWRMNFLSALIAASAAVTYCLLAPKWYWAQTMVAQARQESASSAVGALGGQLGGLSWLAGADLRI
jgi:uncharacterized protein involved in exopolysaccharide biosynthesis